jgi:hypothetical protein
MHHEANLQSIAGPLARFVDASTFPAGTEFRSLDLENRRNLSFTYD